MGLSVIHEKYGISFQNLYGTLFENSGSNLTHNIMRFAHIVRNIFDGQNLSNQYVKSLEEGYGITEANEGNFN